jgi:hypothetical protein
MKSCVFASRFVPLCSGLKGEGSLVSAEVLSGVDELIKN